MTSKIMRAAGALACLFVPFAALANGDTEAATSASFPVEFILFALLLVGVALFHHHTLLVAGTGLSVILAYKLIFTEFNLVHQLEHEALTLANLLGLLVGFAILATFFSKSKFPDLLPKYLPNDWKGGAVLIIAIAVLSSFLDNIAAAVIGGTIAYSVYNARVHVAFIAAIVGASNAGGAGSVVGDTTTTMMWIDGVPASEVVQAFWGSVPSVLLLAAFAGVIQQKYQPIQSDVRESVTIDWKYILACVMILIGAIAANILFDLPALGVWVAIIVSLLFARVDWEELPGALKGALFLLCLVFAASLMPVERLPEASWLSALALGFVSAVFDNIPLTKLALEQGGYDWGMLAYTVGFGGSMIWFGSSAGVAISGLFPQAKSVSQWLRHGWFVILAYLVGFTALYFISGWNP